MSLLAGEAGWAIFPYLAILVGWATTYVWRALGVYLSGRIDAGSPVFEWVACVTYALLAGLIARMILLPTGPLAESPLPDRLAGAVIAFAVFFLTRRNMLLGVFAGAGALILISWGRLALF